jgi:hypothetical protein
LFCIENYNRFHFNILNDITGFIQASISNNLEFNDSGAAKFIIDQILELLDTFPQAKPHDFENYVSQNMDKIAEIEKRVYGELYTTLTQEIENLRRIYFQCVFLPFSTGLVFCGFGEKEYLPVTYSLIVTDIRNSKLVYCKEDRKGSCIIPFAQRAAVDLFMEEKSPRLMSKITECLHDGVSEKAQYIINKINEESQSYCQNKLEVLESFPVHELAFVAETLVTFSSFQTKLSKELETVGGPIDVAVITKGDGFVWMKRKCYFQPALNPHFFEKQ